MKKSDFLQILESFPGKLELRNYTVEDLVSKYSELKSTGIIQDFSKFKTVNLQKHNEEMWFKFLSFLLIATELADDDTIPVASLSANSQRIADRIVCKFNDKFHGSRNIIQDIGGITLDELIKFAQSGEDLI